MSDQDVAGGLMLIAGILLVLGTMTVIFFQWQRDLEEEAGSREQEAGGTAVASRE
jgi:cytochrome c oxidase assembly factor CtaG